MEKKNLEFLRIAKLIAFLIIVSYLKLSAQSTNLYIEPEPIRSFQTNGTAWDIACGDFNGDGLEDLATANLTHSTVTVLLNETDGEKLYFSEGYNIEVGSWPSTIVAGDFDQDGKADIITANEEDKNLTILHNLSNNSEINFKRIDNYETGERPSSMVAKDFDQDGKLDIAFCNYWSEFIQIFRNTSDSSIIRFEEAEKIDIDHFTNTLLADDFNGDNKVDIATVKGGLKVFINLSSTGNVSFSEANEFTIFGIPDHAISGDFNNDGKSDIGIIDDGELTFARNNSTLNSIEFEHQWNSKFKISPKSYFATTCDFNDDNKLDILSVCPLIHFGNANCIAIALNQSESNSFNFEEYHRIEVAEDPISAVCTDFNKDGKIDIAVGSDDGHCVSVLKNQNNEGEINFNSVNRISIDADGFIAGADFDGDGKVDLITDEWNVYEPGIIVLANKSETDSLNFKIAYTETTGYLPNSLTIADFNNDSKLDVAIANGDRDSDDSDKSISILMNTSYLGDMSFSMSKIQLNCNPVYITSDDFDLDGKIDLIVATDSPDSIIVFENNSEIENLKFERVWGYDGCGRNLTIAISDFDGDEFPDFVLGESMISKLYIFLNQSNSERISFTNQGYKGGFYGVSALATEDIDGDNKIDLVVARDDGSDGGACSILRNTSSRGAISFSDQIKYLPLPYPNSVSVSDLTGDEKPDIIVGNRVYQFTILENKCSPGTISFSPAIPGTIILGHSNVSIHCDNTLFVSDLYGDGGKDIVSKGNGEILVLQTSNNPFTYIKNEIYEQPTAYLLGQNYPNPFNPETRINFQLPNPGKITIKIYDILGREVKTLVDDFYAAGQYTISWDGSNELGNSVASGVYFYRLQVSTSNNKDFSEIKKMLMVR